MDLAMQLYCLNLHEQRLHQSKGLCLCLLRGNTHMRMHGRRGKKRDFLEFSTSIMYLVK